MASSWLDKVFCASSPSLKEQKGAFPIRAIDPDKEQAIISISISISIRMYRVPRPQSPMGAMWWTWLGVGMGDGVGGAEKETSFFLPLFAVIKRCVAVDAGGESWSLGATNQTTSFLLLSWPEMIHVLVLCQPAQTRFRGPRRTGCRNAHDC